jgi:archaeal flagellar protein FlaH
MDLATSGISGLDAQLGGGFPRGSTILLLGDPCNALSVFAEQFCAGGLVAGEPVLYFQFDRPARGAGDRIKKLAQELGGNKGTIKVLDGYSGQFGANGKNGNGHATDFVLLSPDKALGEVLNEALKAGAGKYRLAVDTLSSVAKPGRDDEVVDFFRNLVHVGHETGGLHLVSIVRGMHSPPLEARLKHLATGVLEIGVERKGFGLYNYLQVNKMLDLSDPTRLLLFKETEKGLWLESTKRVF